MYSSLRLWSLMGNSQRLDGGAMFGNAPKALWTRWMIPDEQNRIPLACRCLLIQEPEGRLILCEAGIGAFFDPKMRDRFGIQEEEHVLLKSLDEAGFKPDDVDVIVLSHLHFDHAGGLLKAWSPDQPAELCFPHAHYIIGEEAWERATHPHSRDRASFIPELMSLLTHTSHLEIVPTGEGSKILGAQYQFYMSHGHTPGQLHLQIPSEDGPILFCGDLVPGEPWVHLPITMGYDRYPELLIDEKSEILSALLKERGRLFFTHDPHCAMVRFQQNARGKYEAVERWESLKEFEI